MDFCISRKPLYFAYFDDTTNLQYLDGISNQNAEY